MSTSTDTQTDLTKELLLEDPQAKRSAIESFSEKEISDEQAELLVKCLFDDDSGVRDAAEKVLLNNKREVVAKKIVPYISSKNITIRNLAGEVLIKFGEEAVTPLTDYIEGANDDDQKFVIDVLGLIGSDKPAPQFSKVLEESKNSNVKLACVEAFGNLKYAGAVGQIKKYYYEDEVYQPTVVEALGKINSPEANEFLMSIYANADELTKYAIIESFGDNGDEETFIHLTSELKKLNGPLLWVTIEALAKLKAAQNFMIPFDEHIKNALIRVLSESELNFQQAAVSLFESFDDKDVVVKVIALYGSDETLDENIKEKIYNNPIVFLSALLNYDFDSAANKSSVFELTKDVIGYFGQDVLQKLGELKAKKMFEIFSSHISDVDEEIRKTCVELLFFCSPELALLYTDEMLRDDNMWNRMRYLEILSYFMDVSEAVEAVKVLSEDKEEMISEKARELLETVS